MRTKATRRRAALILATTGTMLLLACGLALAAQVISCQPGKACHGTAKSDTMRGSSADDRMSGRGNRDVMKGNMGSDKMSGGQGADRMSGGYVMDKLDGGTGNDFLNGGHANDTITGGTGSDTINGGPGNDTVFAADGELDSISCGLGEDDVAFVDQADLDAEGTNMQDFIRLTSCETINEPVIEESPVETASAR